MKNLCINICEITNPCLNAVQTIQINKSENVRSTYKIIPKGFPRFKEYRLFMSGIFILLNTMNIQLKSL